MQSLVALIAQFRSSHLETLLTSVCLLLLPVLVLAARRELATLVPRRSKREIGALLLVLAVALALRVHPMADPFQHRVYFDEWEYMANARSILLDGQASVCVRGTIEHCLQPAISPNNKIGFTVLQAFAFSLAGISERTAMYLTLAASVASVALAWLLAATLFPGERWSPLTAAVFLTVLPLHIRYSTCAATESMSLFFGGLAMLAGLAAAHTPSRRTQYLAAVTFILAVTVRYENVLLIVPLALLLRRTRGARGPAVLTVVLVSSFLLAYFSSVNVDDATPFTTSITVLARSVRASVPLWLGKDHHPLLLTALALIALWQAPRDRSRLLLLAWLVPFVMLYALHDWPMDIWDQDRHMLQGYFPIVLLAAAGVDALRKFMGGGSDRFVALVALVMVASSLSLLTSCPGQGCRDYVVRELEFALAHREIRPQCVIVAPTPVFINWIWKRRAVYFERFDDVDDILARGECAILHENFYCDPGELGPAKVYWRIPAVCDAYRERYDVRTILEDIDGPYPIRLSTLSSKGS